MKVAEIIKQCPNLTLNICASDLRQLFIEWDAEAEADRQREQEARKAEAEALLTTEEVKAKLNVSLTSLWRWRKSGYLTPIKLGQKVLYKAGDISKLLRGGGEA